MSTEPAPVGGEEMPSVRCPVCGKSVPPGAFCGSCGANLSPQHGGGPAWLRMRTYAAAPREPVLRLSVASSLFPRLPRRSRATFRAALAALLIALVLVAVLRWQATLIAISALGLLVCFVMYLKESDVFKDLPVRTLLLAALAGVGLGVGWAVLTGTVVARSYLVALGAGMTQGLPLWEGLAVALGGAVLMLLPVVLVRISRPQARESLDGYVIGSLGALCFTAAATLTRLAPQLETGPVTRERPVVGLLVEAGIRGVAMPLAAAAVGGIVGTTLWFRRRADIPQRHRLRSLAILLLEFVVVLIVYGGLDLVDIAGLRQGLQLGLYVVITVLALLALRIVLQAALLYEAHDEMSPDEPVLCTECGYVVPDMAFCAHCGMAASASSRSSRTARRLARPVPIDPTAAGP
jgi:predicted amidophosphoribosyltransferase